MLWKRNYLNNVGFIQNFNINYNRRIKMLKIQ